MASTVSNGPELYAFLFTDIEGSSLLWLNHRAVMQEALAAHDALMRETVSRHNGEVFKTAGDAFFAVFHRPTDAVRAASDTQVALAALSWPGIGALKVRMAIHFGTAEKRDGDYFGPALNRCARLLPLGHGGQILVTSAVAELLGSEREVANRIRHLGSHPLDDPLQRVAVHQVVVEDLPQDFPPLRVTQAYPNNLPRRQGRLIGREGELAQIARLLKSSDLVTITGTGGVGKTRIAIEVGLSQLAEHEDGVWLVELAPVSDPNLVASAIARAMGIELSDSQDPQGQLVDRLRPRRTLIVLDNCEHLIDAVAGLVEAILETSSEVKLLTSSQELLGVQGEQVFRLRSLGEPDAITLFAERAKSVDSNFAVTTQNAATITAICQRLDGIPLAIEMAAARAPTLGCEGLLQRLDDRFRVLTGGRRTALPRQRTLLATLDWSHSLLSATDAAVFRRLGVFVGGLTLEAASDVAADEKVDSYAVIDALSSLVAKSLVAADTEDNHTRYRLLETTRAYAQEKLAASGEAAAIQRKHAEYFLKFCEPVFSDCWGSMSDETFYVRYAADLDNVDRAIEWAFGPAGDNELGIALTSASGGIWESRCLWPNFVALAEIAVTRISSATPNGVRTRLLAQQAWTRSAMFRGKALPDIESALVVVRETSDRREMVLALVGKMMSILLLGRSEELQACSSELGEQMAGFPFSRLVGWAKYMQGFAVWEEKGPLAAQPLFDVLVSQLDSIGADGLRKSGIGDTNTSTAPFDDPETSIGALRGELERIRPTQFHNGYNTATLSSRLMIALGLRGLPDDFEESRRVARICEMTRSRFVDFRYPLGLAFVALGSGRPKEAVRIAGFADAWRQSMGVDFFWSQAVFGQAWDRLSKGVTAEEFSALREEGANMTIDEAFRLAMGSE